MAANFNLFSIRNQNQLRSAFRWLLLAVSLTLTLSGCGGLTIRQSFEQGVKKEIAQDYKGAIVDFDEAIANQSRLPGFLLSTHKINLKAGRPSDLIFLNEAYFHRATCKGMLDDIAGGKEDYLLYEKQKVADDLIMAEINAEKADAAKEVAGAKAEADAAAAEFKRTGKYPYGTDAKSCVRKFIGFTNTCSQNIRITVRSASGSGGKMCSGDGTYTLRPNQEFKVSMDCGNMVDVTSAVYLDH